MTKIEMHKADAAFRLADDAWQAALVDVFGRDACNARYAPAGHGAEGSALRAAYDARTQALDIWDARASDWHQNGHDIVR
ncbi:MAG: hypothetical protein WC829_02045 [Hyphomicrobium sp.]